MEVDHRMNPYLVTAYAIFCSAPLVIAISLWLRRRKVRHDVRSLQEQREERIEKENGGYQP